MGRIVFIGRLAARDVRYRPASAAQALTALAGALLGIPGGIGLFSAVNKDGNPVALPPLWWLAATVLGTVAAVAAITAAPAWLGTRRPAAEVLESELA